MLTLLLLPSTLTTNNRLPPLLLLRSPPTLHHLLLPLLLLTMLKLLTMLTAQTTLMLAIRFRTISQWTSMTLGSTHCLRKAPSRLDKLIPLFKGFPSLLELLGLLKILVNKTIQWTLMHLRDPTTLNMSTLLGTTIGYFNNLCNLPNNHLQNSPHRYPNCLVRFPLRLNWQSTTSPTITGDASFFRLLSMSSGDTSGHLQPHQLQW
jgi:hypothetical protein